MSVKQFPADYADITADASFVFGAKADGTPGKVQYGLANVVGLKTWNGGDNANDLKEGAQVRFLANHPAVLGGAAPFAAALTVGASTGEVNRWGYIWQMYKSLNSNRWWLRGGKESTNGLADAPFEIWHSGNFTPSVSSPDLKENIETLELDAIEVINSIQIKKFDFKDELEPKYTFKQGVKDQIGFTIDENLPEVLRLKKTNEVTGETETFTDQYNPDTVMGLLLKAVQELSVKNEGLTARIKVLEGK